MIAQLIYLEVVFVNGVQSDIFFTFFLLTFLAFVILDSFVWKYTNILDC